ncbi:MAG: radical SAM/SPASM domain-containing protein [Bacteroidetes bacterium]|nr:MAG: radical SAM/SPASM domain-containing protein [Bacteroidota bacterium]
MSVTDIPLKKRLALRLHQKYRENESKLHTLKYIFWECTLRCNLNCLHCGSDCKKDAAVADMPKEVFLKALDEITPILNPSETQIVLTGGEAMLRKDIFEVGQAIYDRGFPWGMVTNGMALNDTTIPKLLQSGLRALTISLDGLEKSHNTLRGHRHSYKRSLRAIELLRDRPGLRYDVVSCANQLNINELPELYEKLLERGLKEWRIFTVFPIGRAREHEFLQLPASDFKRLFDFIEGVRNEGRIKLNYGCEGFLGNYEGRVRDNFFFCRAGINVASILVDGAISACPNLRDNFIQGNIYKDSFREVWTRGYGMYRDRSWTKTSQCAKCRFFKYCEGNGMHLHDEKTGELLFCHLKRIQQGE